MLDSPQSQILAFDDFLEASSLGQHNVAPFRDRIADWDIGNVVVDPLIHPEKRHDLPMVRDPLQRLLGRRRSKRNFGERPLSRRQVARILAATGTVRGQRVLPSAGGLNPIHVYGIARNVAASLPVAVFKYMQANHGVVPIGELPPDAVLRELFQLQTESMPQLLIVFVAAPGATIAKYGERGGRFLLQEVGHAAHSIGLRLARDRLRGYALGGLLDEPILQLLRIGHTEARVLSGFACGR